MRAFQLATRAGKERSRKPGFVKPVSLPCRRPHFWFSSLRSRFIACRCQDCAHVEPRRALIRINKNYKLKSSCDRTDATPLSPGHCRDRSRPDSRSIASTFATVRHRTRQTKGSLSGNKTRIMVFELIKSAEENRAALGQWPDCSDIEPCCCHVYIALAKT
jgi:hypothetical protein